MSGPTGQLLCVAGLTARAADRTLIDAVTFDVAAAGTTVLLGRNGAGKTTTMRAILGLAPTAGAVTGAVTLDGEPIHHLPTHARIRRGLGYVPEDRRVFPALTVAENLRLAEQSGIRPRYDLVYDLFPELSARAGQRAGTLSGGQQQMVAIGRALLRDNRLLLIDEPTKGLAPRVVTQVAAALERIATSVPILLVEQNLAVVRRLAGDVIVLTDGHLAYTGTTTQLLQEPGLTRSLLGVATSATATGAPS